MNLEKVKQVLYEQLIKCLEMNLSRRHVESILKSLRSVKRLEESTNDLPLSEEQTQNYEKKLEGYLSNKVNKLEDNLSLSELKEIYLMFNMLENYRNNEIDCLTVW